MSVHRLKGSGLISGQGPVLYLGCKPDPGPGGNPLMFLSLVDDSLSLSPPTPPSLSKNQFGGGEISSGED